MTSDGGPSGSAVTANYPWAVGPMSATSIGTTNNFLDGGKINTQIAISKLGATEGNIWYWLNNEINSYHPMGVTDWYIGCRTELNEFFNSGIITKTDFTLMWSSEESTNSYAYIYRTDYYNPWDSLSKQQQRRVLPIRAF